MYSEKQAKEKVLELVNDPDINREEDEFVISCIHLSKNRDYWVVQANSKAYIEDGDTSRCYVGVSAYMLNVETGEIEIIGSAQSPEHFLQDKYDVKTAAGKIYTLVCAHSEADKKTIVKIHQLFKCSLKKAKYLLRENRNWFSGRRRHLEEAQRLIASKGLETEIVLLNSNMAIAEIHSEIIWWEALEKIIAAEIVA